MYNEFDDGENISLFAMPPGMHMPSFSVTRSTYFFSIGNLRT